MAGGTAFLVTIDEEQCAASNSTYLVLVSSAFERQTWLWLYASMSWINAEVRTRFGMPLQSRRMSVGHFDQLAADQLHQEISATFASKLANDSYSDQKDRGFLSEDSDKEGNKLLLSP